MLFRETRGVGLEMRLLVSVYQALVRTPISLPILTTSFIWSQSRKSYAMRPLCSPVTPDGRSPAFATPIDRLQLEGYFARAPNSVRQWTVLIPPFKQPHQPRYRGVPKVRTTEPVTWLTVVSIRIASFLVSFLFEWPDVGSISVLAHRRARQGQVNQPAKTISPIMQ